MYSTMVIPNREILSVYKRTIQQWFEETVKQEKHPPLLQAVLDEDLQAVQNEINRWLRKCISFYDTKENFYHGFLAGLLVGSEIYQVKSNRENGDGRTDITICKYQTREVAVVIEVKIAKTFRELGAKCDEALKQIRDLKYDVQLIDDCYQKVIRYPLDAGFRKAHVNIKIRRNVPRTILLAVFLRSYLTFQMLYICYTSEDDRVKCWNFIRITTDIAISQQSKEVYENLVVSRTINLVNQ